MCESRYSLTCVTVSVAAACNVSSTLPLRHRYLIIAGSEKRQDWTDTPHTELLTRTQGDSKKMITPPRPALAHAQRLPACVNSYIFKTKGCQGRISHPASCDPLIARPVRWAKRAPPKVDEMCGKSGSYRESAFREKHLKQSAVESRTLGWTTRKRFVSFLFWPSWPSPHRCEPTPQGTIRFPQPREATQCEPHCRCRGGC